MKYVWLGAALLFHCASSNAADMYLRGGFNGWGIDHPLVKVGPQRYQARVTLSPGNHPFKVGSSDWAAEWGIDGEPSVTVNPGTRYRLDTRAGKEDFLFVRHSADYVFSIDLADPAVPVLSVERLPAPPVVKTNPHKSHRQRYAMPFPTWDGKREVATFSSPDLRAPFRQYVQSTSVQLRDPGPQHVSYREDATLPVSRSGNLAFDALFALGLSEMRQNSVSRISDGNYNGGQPVPCDCFETGEKWHYVWTRDLSYAADLGLALLDPQRVRNSLESKLSPFRAGLTPPAQLAAGDNGLQIIQDTGSGGSWPVSTDRVSWAFGAQQALRTLPPAERKAFAQRALTALRNTILADRVAVFDRATGLYMGEQSFLDWRDQSYASWIVNDLASMTTSKALSTNVAHYQALRLAASLAQGAEADQFAQWAAQLKTAINAHLWLEKAQLYSSLTAAHFDGAAMHKFDWLGQALAVISGVADGERAAAIVASYPHGPMGAPVIYPQQQGMPVYHNRAIWPFVTAYGLQAAAKVGNAAVADAAYRTLMRGAALNLSNMENLEWLSGQALLLDEQHPDLIGPVIKSRRQLWSVGAYLGMVIHNVYGFVPTDTGFDLQPFITARLRREIFKGSDSITLRNLSYHGKRYAITIKLAPAARGEGHYAVRSIAINGRPHGASVNTETHSPENSIVVTLGELIPDQQRITRVSGNPYAKSGPLFAPRDPAAPALAGATLTLPQAPGSAINVYRDGVLIAARVKAVSWTDPAPVAHSCYAIDVEDAVSGRRSHHSPPVCAGTVINIPLERSQWGRPGDTLHVDVPVTEAGQYQVQLRYHNGANQINLGISGGVKWLSLRAANGRVVSEGVVSMPHSARPQVYSTPVRATLQPGRHTVELGDFYNMSYLQANSTFSAAGGLSGPSNRFDIHGVRLLRVK